MSNDSPRPAHGLRRIIGPDYGWIGAQLGLLAAGGIGGLIEVALRGRGFVPGSTIIALLTGGALMLASILTLGKATKDLSDNVTMSPTPVDDAQVVESGIYGHVRHPMYAGVLLLMGGFALMIGSWIALGVTAALVPFLTAKSRHEEKMLVSRFPEYDDYRRRVRSRFIPWIV